jgi:hypothetical protein
MKKHNVRGSLKWQTPFMTVAMLPSQQQFNLLPKPPAARAPKRFPDEPVVLRPGCSNLQRSVNLLALTPKPYQCLLTAKFAATLLEESTDGHG